MSLAPTIDDILEKFKPKGARYVVITYYGGQIGSIFGPFESFPAAQQYADRQGEAEVWGLYPPVT